MMCTLIVLCLMVLSMSKSYAYIDPGTGSYLLQMIAAGVLAGSFFVKTFWRRIKQGYQRLLSKRQTK